MNQAQKPDNTTQKTARCNWSPQTPSLLSVNPPSSASNRSTRSTSLPTYQPTNSVCNLLRHGNTATRGLWVAAKHTAAAAAITAPAEVTPAFLASPPRPYKRHPFFQIPDSLLLSLYSPLSPLHTLKYTHRHDEHLHTHCENDTTLVCTPPPSPACIGVFL